MQRNIVSCRKTILLNIDDIYQKKSWINVQEEYTEKNSRTNRWRVKRGYRRQSLDWSTEKQKENERGNV
jgi:hypothetical protein